MNSGYCPHNIPAANCAKCNPGAPPRFAYSTPELDSAIDKLERLAISTEPRSPYEDKLTDLVLVIAKTCRHHIQQVR